MPELDKEYRIAQLLAKKMVGDLALEENAELQELQANADISDELVERILNLKNKQKRDEFVGGLNVEGAWKQVEKESMNIISVKKDKDRPFIVKTDNIKIEVLGTEFNVKSYPELKEIATTLCEGSVSVTDGSHDLILKPSYQAIYSKSSHLMTSKKVDTRLYTGWKNGLFIFENETLEDIMITLSRWYNINVFFVNERIKTFHFTGDLKRYGDFTKTLEMIEKTTSI